MSELKAYCPHANRDGFYHKSEAEKVIAKKDAEIAELKKKLMPCLNGDCILTCEVVEKYGKENAELKARIQLDDDEMAGFLDLEEECGVGDLRNYIAELKQKLDEKDKDIESLKASHYAEMVDAGMRERRLRRALYKACANWAKCEERISNMDAYDASEYLPSAEKQFRKKAEQWSEMKSKCLKKAEEYK